MSDALPSFFIDCKPCDPEEVQVPPLNNQEYWFGDQGTRAVNSAQDTPISFQQARLLWGGLNTGDCAVPSGRSIISSVSSVTIMRAFSLAKSSTP